jgi:NDP-sugar pyrophosphorylase family protein
MKPILIIPLMGKRHKNLFIKNNFFFNKKYDYLLNHISKNFKFCSKIIIICKNKDSNYIKFKKSSKIKFFHLKSSKNQIDTILKSKKLISSKDSIFILNPDAFFILDKNIINFKKNLSKSEITLFGIKDLRHLQNQMYKDTFKILNNKISSIKIKEGNADGVKSFISAGLYFFKNFKIFEALCEKFSKKNNLYKYNYQIGNLLKYSLLIKKINYLFVNNFIDFGDNKKIDEYFFWLNFFKKKFFDNDNHKFKKILNIIPAAGEGSRHKKLGYNKPKPLIPISGKTMFENSIDRLPNRKENIFIFRKNTFTKYKVKKIFSKNRDLKKYFLINKKTKGMAETILLAKNKLPLDVPGLVSSCDISFIINYKKFYKLLSKKPDGIIFTWRNYPFADESPNSHAYVKVKNEIVTEISEKKTISENPNNDFAVTGIFYFRNIKILIDCIEHMMKNKITVNNEYYVATSMDKMLKNKMKIFNFEVDQFISWSLPEHLQKYNHWEKIFK